MSQKIKIYSLDDLKYDVCYMHYGTSMCGYMLKSYLTTPWRYLITLV
jgi:hypothetical protein